MNTTPGMPGLIKIIAEKSLMPPSEITESSDLFRELELDSLCFIEVLVSVEKIFGVKINPAVVPQAEVNTPAKLFSKILLLKGSLA